MQKPVKIAIIVVVEGEIPTITVMLIAEIVAMVDFFTLVLTAIVDVGTAVTLVAILIVAILQYREDIDAGNAKVKLHNIN